MLKKIICFSLALSLMLGGCSIFKDSSKGVTGNDKVIPPETPNSPVTLEMICYKYTENSNELWQNIKNDFESKNQGITLNIQVLPWKEANMELETRLFNDESIDIAVTDNLESFIQRDLLVSTDLFSSDELRAGVLFGIDSSSGLPLAGDVFELFIKNEVASVSGITQESIDSVGWEAILHGREHFSEMGIPYNFFIDVNDNAIDLSRDVLLKSTNESPETDGITKSLITSVSTEKELRHKTAFDGVLGVINGEIGMAVAPGSIRHILPKDLPTDGWTTFSLPGEPYVLCDYFGVFKKNGEDEQNRLDAIKKFMEYFYGEAYTDFLSGEGYKGVINFN